MGFRFVACRFLNSMHFWFRSSSVVLAVIPSSPPPLSLLLSLFLIFFLSISRSLFFFQYSLSPSTSTALYIFSLFPSYYFTLYRSTAVPPSMYVSLLNRNESQKMIDTYNAIFELKQLMQITQLGWLIRIRAIYT